jgi:hypothetical protein
MTLLNLYRNIIGSLLLKILHIARLMVLSFCFTVERAKIVKTTGVMF